jgi:hypothetical protein
MSRVLLLRKRQHGFPHAKYLSEEALGKMLAPVTADGLRKGDLVALQNMFDLLDMELSKSFAVASPSACRFG